MSEKYARQPPRKSLETVFNCQYVLRVLSPPQSAPCPPPPLLPPSLLLPPFACLIAPTQSNRGNFIRHLRWKKVESSRVASSSTRNLQTEFTRGPQIISNTVPQPPNRGVADQKRERKRHATRTSTSCLEMYLWLRRAWLRSSYVESWIQQWSLAFVGDKLTTSTYRYPLRGSNSHSISYIYHYYILLI